MKCLYEAAQHCIDASDPETKIRLTREAAAAFFSGQLSTDIAREGPQAIKAPGRPDKPILVPPKNLPKRGMGTTAGRACFLHAITHIEFNAVNLAWDAVYRFRDMPYEYYADFVKVASDEARHFSMLSKRLQEMDMQYGDFEAHNGLWEMAEKTAHSCLARMALVPRVLEARGLDVTPGMMSRLRSVGDHVSADILEIILEEEIPHVAAGTRWFLWCCEQENKEPLQTFSDLITGLAKASIRGPYNLPARNAAGFGDAEIAMLEELSTQVVFN
ncbi:MAG: ferritin-like domain-containing protein [Arenimonas sp.]